MIILDTNVVSEVVKPRPDSTVVNWLNHNLEGNICTTSISVQESFYGTELIVDVTRREALRGQLEQLYERLVVLPYDETCARFTVVLLARARLSGHPMHPHDAQIGGIALRHGATLATRNVRDFAHTPVAVVNPWLP